MSKDNTNTSKILTMADLLAKYSKTKTELKPLKKGDKIEGLVVEKNPGSVVLDIGRKSEGIVTDKAFSEAREFIKGINVGDKLIADVLIPENSEGYTILSFRQSATNSVWEKMESALSKKEVLDAKVTSFNSAGLSVSALGLPGFIPSSHLGSVALGKGDALVGTSLKVQVIELDREHKKAIFSEKIVSEAGAIKDQDEVIKNLKLGDILEGEVVTVTDFGCFVKVNVALGKKTVPVEGLVHVSELSYQKVDKPSSVVKVGDKLKVAVISSDAGRLSLSVKSAKKDPWVEAAGKYNKEDKVAGKVTRVSDFGVFIELEPGVEGLLHMTKLPPGQKLSAGQSVNVYIEEVDTNARRISLGMVLTEKPLGYK